MRTIEELLVASARGEVLVGEELWAVCLHKASQNFPSDEVEDEDDNDPFTRETF